MPIYVLRRFNRFVEIPNQVLTVSISDSVQGGAPAVRADADQPMMQPNSHLAVLPRLSGPVSIGVVSGAGQERFALGTEVSLTIWHEAPSELDPVHVMFDPVDLSDDSSVELARLTPNVRGIEVAAVAAADNPLSPLASAARRSARQIVERSSRAPVGPVLVALDTSASMRPVFADGLPRRPPMSLLAWRTPSGSAMFRRC